MTVDFAKGDLFDPNFGFEAICHGVNCKGVMGSGIAVAFKGLYPEMFKAYRDMCLQGFLLPGMVMPWKTGNDNPKVVYNIASQYNPGPDGNYGALEVGLRWVDFHARTHKIESVGLPEIGCGIAGLDWNLVKYMADEMLGSSPVNYTFVTWEK